MKLKLLLSIAFININKIVLSRSILFDKKITILSKISSIARIC
jgi:hypothetical protein